MFQHLFLTIPPLFHHLHNLVILPRVSELLSKLRRVFYDSLPQRLVVLRPIAPSLFPYRIHKPMRQLIQRLRTTVSLVHSRHSVNVCVQMAVQIRRHAFSVDRFQLLAVEVVVLRGVETIFQHAFDAQAVAERHAVLAVEASEHDAVFGLQRREGSDQVRGRRRHCGRREKPRNGNAHRSGCRTSRIGCNWGAFDGSCGMCCDPTR